jgi:putative DNA methylase
MATDLGVGLPSALETAFPAGTISKLSQYESWRKELHRPATYVQKWWAQRLGTVMRAILCAAVTENRIAALRAYRTSTRLSNLVVLDPFAGSGTTLVEAAKLGATVIGRDINPVATLAQRQALREWDIDALEGAFRSVREACSGKVAELYRTAEGEAVLCYFWVAVTDCPVCGVDVELFSRYIFAQHAYPRDHPVAHAVCPSCHGIVALNLFTDNEIRCNSCGQVSLIDGPVSRLGSAHGRKMSCVNGHKCDILSEPLRDPLQRRMFAKLVVTSDGSRQYRAVDDFDIDLYSRAGRLLRRHRLALLQPRGKLTPGNSTAQALRWGFREWASFFNERQLYCLGLTATAIRDLEVGPAEREALIALFSKALEFNNLFTSYKGEGTGAVRSIFHNHTLRPERTPLEANPWGIASSSGSMAQLFNRLTRAHEYKRTPRDLLLSRNKVTVSVGLSLPLARPIVESYGKLVSHPGAAYISCGDSAVMDLPDGSVDLVVTDPPYVGKVHYSELADFFHAWLRQLRPFPSYPHRWESTRRSREVQSSSAETFGKGLARVWREVSRVLRDDGLLVFSFHQTESGGWHAVMTALREAGLVVTAVQPVMAEMTTSVAKSSFCHPNNLDSLVVCRKQGRNVPWVRTPAEAAAKAVQALRALRRAGIAFTSGDVMSVVRGSVLSLLTNPSSEGSDGLAAKADAKATSAVVSLYAEPRSGQASRNRKG